MGLYRRLAGTAQTQGVEAGLTARELSVLALLAEGLPTQVIAHRLGCSPRTIDKHLERTYRKLGVSDRVNALRIAQQWNLSGMPTQGCVSVNGRVTADL